MFVALSTLGEPNSIEAKGKFFDSGADSECAILFHYDKAKAILKSTLLEDTKTEAIFTCQHGTIKINGRFNEPSSVTLINRHGNSELKTFDYKTIGFSYEIEHFNQLIRDGITESPDMTFERSKQLIETLDEIRCFIGLEYS